MNNSLLILLLGSILIVSGCDAKDDTNNSSSDNNIKETEETSLKNETSRERNNEVKAPNFKLATISGEEFYLSDYAGKVVMLNFWGTWCPPCRKEIPDLVNLQKKYNKDGLEIVGITLNSGSAKDIQKFADKKQINYTILTDFSNDETHEVTNLYGQTSNIFYPHNPSY
jgi:peroxiredoxin